MTTRLARHLTGTCKGCNTADVPIRPTTGPTTWAGTVALREVTWLCATCTPEAS